MPASPSTSTTCGWPRRAAAAAATKMASSPARPTNTPLPAAAAPGGNVSWGSVNARLPGAGPAHPGRRPRPNRPGSHPYRGAARPRLIPAMHTPQLPSPPPLRQGQFPMPEPCPAAGPHRSPAPPRPRSPIYRSGLLTRGPPAPTGRPSIRCCAVPAAVCLLLRARPRYIPGETAHFPRNKPIWATRVWPGQGIGSSLSHGAPVSGAPVRFPKARGLAAGGRVRTCSSQVGGEEAGYAPARVPGCFSIRAVPHQRCHYLHHQGDRVPGAFVVIEERVADVRVLLDIMGNPRCGQRAVQAACGATQRQIPGAEAGDNRAGARQQRAGVFGTCHE